MHLATLDREYGKPSHQYLDFCINLLSLPTWCPLRPAQVQIAAQAVRICSWSFFQSSGGLPSTFNYPPQLEETPATCHLPPAGGQYNLIMSVAIKCPALENPADCWRNDRQTLND